MQKEDDWQNSLIARRVEFSEEAKLDLKKIEETVARAQQIVKSIVDFLRSAAHKGKPIGYNSYIVQANIPGSTDRLTCQYTFDERTVTIHYLYRESIEE